MDLVIYGHHEHKSIRDKESPTADDNTFVTSAAIASKGMQHWSFLKVPSHLITH